MPRCCSDSAEPIPRPVHHANKLQQHQQAPSFSYTRLRHRFYLMRPVISSQLYALSCTSWSNTKTITIELVLEHLCVKLDLWDCCSGIFAFTFHTAQMSLTFICIHMYILCILLTALFQMEIKRIYIHTYIHQIITDI